ncbi:MAG: hypothetical protein LBS92_07955 [Candidatus Methanoplasma sp.]|jgi:hypothetical protein|nr:hypothetical protein [Candidatus Methanoplasma sp.]
MGVLRCTVMVRRRTHLRTSETEPNDNISVPIGNLTLAEAFFREFGLHGMITTPCLRSADIRV